MAEHAEPKSDPGRQAPISHGPRRSFQRTELDIPSSSPVVYDYIIEPAREERRQARVPEYPEPPLQIIRTPTRFLFDTTRSVLYN